MLKRILVVEDEPALSRLMKLALAAKYEVWLAPDAHAALKLLDEQPECDLLICDYSLPGLNGPELVARVRSSGRDLQCLFVTGWSSSEMEALQFPVLQKPVKLDQLVATVDRLLGNVG